MKDKRKPGSGSVYQLPSGRWIARVNLGDGRRTSLGLFGDEVDARAVLEAAIVEAAARGIHSPGGTTLMGWFPRWLDQLELSGEYVAMPTARSIWRTWLSKAPFASVPLRAITRRGIEQWAAKIAGELSPSYVNQILQLLRKGLAVAVEEFRIEANPAEGAKQPKRKIATSDPWTYLRRDEIAAVLSCDDIPLPYRRMLGFAIFTGLRAREQFCLRLEDVDLEAPEVFVRFGSKKRAPKGRRRRHVPLIPEAEALVSDWLTELPTWCESNEFGLLFPGPRGGMLDSDRFAAQRTGETGQLATWLRSAGITRHVRWHDLRHTCAAALVSGWWGRSWRLEEVQALLGHRSIDETQRYAHLAPDALRKAARDTQHMGGQFASVSPRNPGGRGAIPSLTQSTEKTRGLPAGPLAERLLRAIAAGEAAEDLADELAGLVLDGDLLELALAVRAGGPHKLARAIDLAACLVETRAESGVA